MKITSMHVRRLRNVLDVAFECDDKIVKISWDNGAGKSTIVDAIFLAIVGKTYIGKGRSIENLITQWHDTSEIEVTLEGNDKKLKIQRKITSKWNMSLDIRSSDGEKLQQRDLDLLLSEFTIDPLEFTRKTKKEQYDTVKTIAWVDTTQIDADILIQEEKTRQARAISTEYKKTLQNAWAPMRVDPVKTDELTNQYKEMIEHNQTVNTIENQKNSLILLIDEKQAKIKQLQEEIEEHQDDLKLEKEKLQVVGPLIGQDKIQEVLHKIQEADETNKKATERERYKTLTEQVTKADVALETEHQKLLGMREMKKKMIQQAQLPIDWLIFSEDEWLMINGIPFDQYSSAQQLIMACKIASHLNPLLKVLYIKDGSLLDNKSMQEMAELAHKEWYQVFIERVWEEVDTIIMRDGEILSTSTNG